MDYKKLSDCAEFRKERTADITFENYITTDNMLPNKGGITVASSLPDVKTTSKYLEGDILLSNIRPYFCKIWFANRQGSCSNDVLVVKCKKGYIPKFIYYVLSDNNFFNYDTVTSKGTKMPRGTPNAIMKYLVPDYDLTTQQKIVDCLESYDKLIENNKKRIEMLDSMIKGIYNEWFVRFRYPGHETEKLIKSRIGKIPESFHETKMEDVFEYYIGGGWGNDEETKDFTQEAYVIRGTDFPNIERGDISSCPLRYHKESNYAKRYLQENDIILEVSGGTAEQPVGRTILVEKEIIDRLGGRVICASFCKLIRLNDKVNPSFFYYWMQFLYETRMIDRFQLQSTGIINFKFEYFLRKGDVMLPPKKLMDKFASTIKPLQQEKHILAYEIENLITQRELLIPRLMSGKLKI